MVVNFKDIHFYYLNYEGYPDRKINMDNMLSSWEVPYTQIPNNADLEISHHYGIDQFYKYGTCLITIINRGYCKKLLILLPGQTHPGMFHKQKDESFFLLYGDLELKLDHKLVEISEGQIVSIEPGVIHEFSSKGGAIIEEVSSTHLQDDSFYEDEKININKNRKTFVKYWLETE